jgi:quercetin dioxygenase-like cupin family protein
MQRREFIASTVAATALSTTALPAAATEQTDKGFVVKSGKSRFGETTRISGTSPNDIKVSGKDTNSNLTVFEYLGNEKGGPPLHVHPNQDEVFYIIEGDYLFDVGGEKQTLTTGDTIFLPRNVPHTFAQLTNKGKMVFFFQPSGKMEDYFRRLGMMTSKPSPQEGAKLFADHDMKVVGPPLAFKQ